MLAKFNPMQPWVLKSYLSTESNLRFGTVVAHIVQNEHHYVLKYLTATASEQIKQYHVCELNHYQNQTLSEIVLEPQRVNVKDLVAYHPQNFALADLDHQVDVLVLPYAIKIEDDLKQTDSEYTALKIKTFIKMCDVIAKLHQLGLIHGDLKFQHFLMFNNQVKILDLANLQKIDDAGTVQSQGGTPAYMAPELYLGKQKSIQSDIYAMGVIFYQMLMCHKPFSAQHYMDWAKAHCQQDIPVLADGLKQYQRVVDHMLAKQLDNRFSTLESVKNALIFS